MYLLRWQLSGVVLAPVLALMTGSPLWELNIVGATAIANLIGGTVFFWVDRIIFKENQNGNKTKRKNKSYRDW